jgi:hypothetical protein
MTRAIFIFVWTVAFFLIPPFLLGVMMFVQLRVGNEPSTELAFGAPFLGIITAVVGFVLGLARKLPGTR